MKYKEIKTINWIIKSGIFRTGYKVELNFKLLEFSPSKKITHAFAVNKTINDSVYNVIIGCNLLKLLKIGILYSKSHLVCDRISITIKTASKVQQAIEEGLKDNVSHIEILECMYCM